MPKIAILYGMENTFPSALVERINRENLRDLTAEHLLIGAIKMEEPPAYRVIIDRISHDIPFYRTYLKNAVLGGTLVINNPFWWSADDSFFNFSLACRLGVAVPKTVVLPHKMHPPGTTVQSMRNLVFPLNWDRIFEHIGFPAFLKPLESGGWNHFYKIQSPEEFFRAYDQTGTTCMTLQSAIDFDEYFRCYVVGQENVRVMKYNPDRPNHLRYDRNEGARAHPLHDRLVNESLTLCRALGYDFNMIEFAVREGTPYAVNFLNPAPDADIRSVGEANFEWVVENVAQLAIQKALSKEQPNGEMHWSSFLNGRSNALAATSK